MKKWKFVFYRELQEEQILYQIIFLICNTSKFIQQKEVFRSSFTPTKNQEWELRAGISGMLDKMPRWASLARVSTQFLVCSFFLSNRLDYNFQFVRYRNNYCFSNNHVSYEISTRKRVLFNWGLIGRQL